MTDLSWLQKLQAGYGDTAFDRLKNAVSNVAIGDLLQDWILQPKGDKITELKLHIYGAETIQLNAEITDNYVESNIAYQDHIALKPKIFTVSGEVGELTWYKNDSVESVIEAIPQKLVPVVSFLPSITKKAQQITDKAMKIIGVVDSLDNFSNRVWQLLSNEDVDTEQKKSCAYLSLLWGNREPINIKTPFGTLNNYVIQNVEFTQPERTQDKSQVKISFKEFRIVNEKYGEFNLNKYQSRASAQKTSKKSKGKTSGVKLNYNECKPGSIFVDDSSMMCRIVGGV